MKKKNRLRHRLDGFFKDGAFFSIIEDSADSKQRSGISNFRNINEANLAILKALKPLELCKNTSLKSRKITYLPEMINALLLQGRIS